MSSSAIRKALEQGDVAAAARGLGRNYSVRGQVISGQRLGRTLGVPTANIALEPTNRLAHGIYAVVARVEGRAFPAVASFGTRPTVDDGPPLLEVHLLDFDGDLYGREMQVEFVERIRDERKFEFDRGAGSRDGARQGAGARHSRREGLRADLANCGKSSNPTRPLPTKPEFGSRSDVRRARLGLDYSRTLYLPKTDFPMRGGSAAEGAGNSGALGARKSLSARFARAARAGPNSFSTTGRLTPTAMSISARRSTRP